MFGFAVKEATVYSLTIILVSQLAKLLAIATTTGYGNYQLSLLPYLVAGAIIGGLCGASLNARLSQEKVLLFFQLVVLGVLGINLYNGIRLFF